MCGGTSYGSRPVRRSWTPSESFGSSRPHAAGEAREDAGDPRVLRDEVLEAHRDEYEATQRTLHQASLGDVLLKPPAVRILQAYERDRWDVNVTGTHTPWQSAHSLVTSYSAELTDRALHDLDHLAWPLDAWRVGARRVRQWRRRVSRLWSEVRYWVSTRLDERRLTRGPQLTQADVRWPPLPKWRHFRSVDQTRRAGLRPGQIQRELRIQQRADPPPWTKRPAKGGARPGPSDGEAH